MHFVEWIVLGAGQERGDRRKSLPSAQSAQPSDSRGLRRPLVESFAPIRIRVLMSKTPEIEGDLSTVDERLASPACHRFVNTSTPLSDGESLDMSLGYNRA